MTDEAEGTYTTQLESGVGFRRFLGVVAGAVLLAAAFWVVGQSVVNTDSSDSTASTGDADTNVEPTTSTVPEAAEAAVSTRELPTHRILPAASLFRDPLVLLPILEGSRIDDPLILVVERGVLRYRSLKTSLWTGNDDRVVRLNPGAGPHPMIVGPEQVAIATLGGIHAQDLTLRDESAAVAQGISILPSATPDAVWVIGSAGSNVALVDLATGSILTEGSLSDFGYPLGGVTNGLLLSPDSESNPDFAVWRPDEGLVTLEGTGDLSLVSFAGTEAVFTTSGESSALVVVDLETGQRLRNVEVELPEFRTGSRGSPDGSKIAVSFQPSVIENNVIVIVDTTSGNQTVAVDDALPWQFQWVDDNRLLYMQSDFPQFRIAVYDYEAGTTTPLIEFDDFSWWFAVQTQLGR